MEACTMHSTWIWFREVCDLTSCKEIWSRWHWALGMISIFASDDADLLILRHKCILQHGLAYMAWDIVQDYHITFVYIYIIVYTFIYIYLTLTYIYIYREIDSRYWMIWMHIDGHKLEQQIVRHCNGMLLDFLPSKEVPQKLQTRSPELSGPR